MNTGIVLLAAGASVRMGEPKQCLACDASGTPLLRIVATAALEAALGPVVVVLGAEGERCRAVLAGLAVRIVVNESWAEGQGGSIAAGASALAADDLAGLLIVLGDQPGVNATRLRELAACHFAGGLPITASRYAGTLGPPVLFSPPLFPRLLAMSGTRGAKSLLQGACPVAAFDLPEGEFDLDTPADLALWRERHGKR